MNPERKHDGQVNLRALLGLGTLPATADAIMLHAANQINAMRQERIQREKNMAEMREALEFIVTEFEESHRNAQERDYHEEADNDGDSMELHRKEEPDCTYCEAIKKARAILGKTKGA